MIPPLNEKEQKNFSFIFNLVEKQMGFVPNSMKTMARVPAILGGFGTLVAGILGDPKDITPITAIRGLFKNAKWLAANGKRKDRVPMYLKQMVAHVSSNAAGCRYCQAHTIGEAVNYGASEEQAKALWDFENSDAFDAKEKAALRFGLAAGQVPNAVTPAHFDQLRQYFTDEQIIELGATVSLFGFLNRWNDTFGTQLETPAIANAEKYLAKSGWEIGKHGISSKRGDERVRR